MDIKRKKAFTLVELMVVMVITGVILALGIISYKNFSDSASLTEATGNVVTILQQTQSMARNNETPKNGTTISVNDKISKTFYYLLVFNNDTSGGHISRLVYMYSKASLSNPWQVVSTENDLELKLSGLFNYGNVTGDCKQILFEGLTGKIMASISINYDSVDKVYSDLTTSCNITVNPVGTASSNKIIYVNVSLGNYGIK